MVPVSTSGVIDLNKGSFATEYLNSIHQACSCDYGPGDTIVLTKREDTEPTGLPGIRQRDATSGIAIIRGQLDLKRSYYSRRRRHEDHPAGGHIPDESPPSKKLAKRHEGNPAGTNSPAQPPPASTLEKASAKLGRPTQNAAMTDTNPGRPKRAPTLISHATTKHNTT